MMMGSVLITHCHSDGRQCDYGQCDHHTVAVMMSVCLSLVGGRCYDCQCEVDVTITMVIDQIIGSHIGHSNDGLCDVHKCDDDLCGW